MICNKSSTMRFIDISVRETLGDILFYTNMQNTDSLFEYCFNIVRRDGNHSSAFFCCFSWGIVASETTPSRVPRALSSLPHPAPRHHRRRRRRKQAFRRRSFHVDDLITGAL